MRAWTVVAFVFLAGCTELPAGLARFAGRFSYLAADSAGQPAFGGTFWLEVLADSTIEGHSPGHTMVTGRVSGDSVYLWMDPNIEGGLDMSAQATSGGFSGIWIGPSIGGPARPRGTFFALRSHNLLPSAP